MLTWLRHHINSFFGFSRTETNAFMLMLPLMALLIFSSPLFRYWYSLQPPPPNDDPCVLDSIVATWKWPEPEPTLKRQIAVIPFNPNLATSNVMIDAGLPENVARRIVHYREKGGKFKVKTDLRKMLGKDSAIFFSLLPYILLPDQQPITRRPPFQKFIQKEIAKFDLNLADTAQLIRIRGIGPKLSVRIANYRARLGGFVSMDQLKEVFGLDSTVIHELEKKSFIANGFIPRQININTADEKKLATLPYIRFTLAKAITAYRFQHGEFESADALRRITLLDEPTFQKIKPYISVKE